jgi:hypothetical protein
LKYWREKKQFCMQAIDIDVKDGGWGGIHIAGLKAVKPWELPPNMPPTTSAYPPGIYPGQCVRLRNTLRPFADQQKIGGAMIALGKLLVVGVALTLLVGASARAAENIDLRSELSALIGDPRLVVDLNRTRIIEQMVKNWKAEMTIEYGSPENAIQALQALPAMHLYAAAMAKGFEDAKAAIQGSTRSASKQLKALGDFNQDFGYTPVTPSRLVETRGGIPAVYQGGGGFSSGEVRNYTVQGGNGVCLAQLPAGLNPTAVVVQVFGIPINGASGDIEILPQGAAFGSTATEVYVGSVPFNTVSTTARINPNNNQISVQVRGGGAHLAIDVVGYFRRATGRPALLQLQPSVAPIPPFGIQLIDAPFCPVGTTLVSGGCLTGSFLVNLVASIKDPTTDHWVCAFSSSSALTQNATAATFCLDTPAKAN